jgi:hypothetical protein
MPKCRIRPYGEEPPNSLSSSWYGRKDRPPLMVVLFDSARSAEPPQNSGSCSAIGLDHRLGGLAGGEVLARRELRQLGVPAGRQRAPGDPVELRGPLRVRGAPGLVRRVPLRVGGLSALADLPGVLQDLVGDLEVPLRVEAEDLLGRGHLGLAERGAVRLAGVLRLGRGPGDDGAQPDDRRAPGLVLGGDDRPVQRLDVFDVAVRRGELDRLGVPAVRLVAPQHVLGEGDLGVALDRDVVVVVDDDEVAELLGARDRGRFAGDALLQVAVRGEGVDAVVERRGAGRRLRVEQPALVTRGHRHADRVRQALAERAGGGLDADGVAVLGVTRRQGAPGAKGLEVVERQPVTGQEQLDVQRQAGVSGGQHEPVAAGPPRIGRVVPQMLLEEQVGGRGQ